MSATSKGLPALLVAVFAGALVDNIYRIAAIGVMTAVAIAGLPDDTAAHDRLATQRSGLALWVFTLPFVLLAPLAGAVGDRLSKRRVIFGVRLMDLPILAFGCCGLWLHQPWMLVVALVLLGIASAFFAPVKLAVLPELVPEPRLPAANAWMQGMTVVAILLGMGLAMVGDPKLLTGLGIPLHPAAMVAIIALGIALAGLVGAWRMPHLPARDPSLPFRPFDFSGQIRVLLTHRGLLVPVLSLSAFWALGSAATILAAPIAKVGWGLDGLGLSGLSLCLALGMIAGAVTAPWLMVRHAPAGLPLVGALVAGGGLVVAGWIGMGVIAHPQHWELGQPLAPGMLPIAALFFACGVGSGWWDVAMNVLLQERSPLAERNRVMASYSFLSNIGMLAMSECCQRATLLPDFSSAGLMCVIGCLYVVLTLAGMGVFHRQMVGWLTRRPV